VLSPRPKQFYHNAVCTRIGGVPAANGSARGITGTLVFLYSRSWFYLVGVFATRTFCHDVPKSYYQQDEHNAMKMLTFLDFL